jgi:glycosyltransferase involved in cell wall biosynthesis
MRPVGKEDARLRVLTLARDAGLGSGGAEVLAYEFVRRLDREQFQPYLCTTRMPVPSRTERVASERIGLESDKIQVLALDRPSTYSIAPWRHLYRLMIRERIDIVHSHMPRASVPGTILGRLARVPIIISHEHGSILENKPVRTFLDRNVVDRWSDVVVTVSEWDRRQMIEVSGMSPDRIRVLPNGIKARSPVGTDIRGELGLRDDQPLIGVVGRLTSQKRQADAIRAVAQLNASAERRVSCVLLGEGPDDAALRTIARDLGIEDQVHLTGNRADVPDVLAALDVAVLSSIWEGAPLAVLEYMAAGAPIVATAVGGVPELIVDGVHGLLVPPRAPGQLAEAIGRLLEDPSLARRLGDAARDRQQAEFDLDVTVKRLQELYLDISRDLDRTGRRR